MEWLAAHPACDMSFAQYLAAQNLDEADAAASSAYVEGFNAADRERIGIASLAQQQCAEDAIDADRLFRMDSGYSSLADFLHGEFARAGGDLFLNAPVRGIEWAPGAAAVRAGESAGERSLKAPQVLITVPLGVLQSDAIAWSPTPEPILAQAGRLIMGDVVRLVFVFKRRFWSEARENGLPKTVLRKLADLSFLCAPGELPTTGWTANPDTTPMLTAWMGGPRAAVLLASIRSCGDRDALLRRCLSTLSRIFQIPHSEMEALLSSWHLHDWTSDPFSRGAYSYVPAGALDASEKLTIPLRDTLYFAGEHTDVTGHWGTVHAALGTGLRAAAQILAAPALL
jgi:monoamine oxidase